MKSVFACLVLAALAGCGESADTAGSRAAERTTSVTVTQPAARDIEYVLTALGSVESIHRPTISAQTSGQVVSVDVSEGESVGAGQLLARIDNTLHGIQAEIAEGELKRLSVMLENQQREVERLKRLEKTQSVSRDQLEDQEAQLAMLEAQRDVASKQWAQARYLESKTRVLAPQAGKIARRHVSLGDYITTGMPMFDLVAVERLRARLAFPEHEAASISPGMRVRLHSPAAPAAIAEGTVTGINPQITIDNRAIEVLVEFPNPGGWLPGASVDATLVVDTHPGALTVPPTSVVTRSGRSVVFVVDSDRDSDRDGDRARERPVELGWREVDWVEVTAGLTAADRVVVKGATLISDNSLLAERP